MTPRAVLLMAYGGPTSLDEVEPFLADIRGGRPTSRALIEEVRERYAAIGGRSPLLEITRAQARALEDRLNAGEGTWRVWVGMRHWRPYIREAVAEIAAAGHRHLTALCLAPHYSRLSIGAYRKKLEEAREELAPELAVDFVESWGEHPLFLAAVAEKVGDAMARLPAAERSRVEILFTAHSLPERILAEGDPYPEQLRSTAEAVADLAGVSRWRFCYQSAGATSDPWLGPALEDVIRGRAAAGVRSFLVVPIGFVSDHVEVLYDVDVEAQGIAVEAGARLTRTASLNDSARFIEALAAVVQEAGRRAGQGGVDRAQ